jgi:hypothetical protein
MKPLISLVLWFESKPSRVLNLLAVLIVMACLAEVVDAQIALARAVLGQ